MGLEGLVEPRGRDQTIIGNGGETRRAAEPEPRVRPALPPAYATQLDWKRPLAPRGLVSVAISATRQGERPRALFTEQDDRQAPLRVRLRTAGLHRTRLETNGTGASQRLDF